ncbi:MAG TPA: SUKH-3 domain-containing protein [Longimicrobium sp.]|nr:SUKH-3 domain-containing protein [Longimicrobium sp.]
MKDDASRIGDLPGSFPHDVEQVLRDSGWKPQSDRTDLCEHWLQQIGDEFAVVSGAKEILNRYGGLSVSLSGPGESWSRQSFRLDPTVALGEGDRFDDFSRMLGTRLFPLGEIGHEAFLAVGEDGRVYALMLDLWLVGRSVEEAIEVLVRGRAPTLIIDEAMYCDWVKRTERSNK